MTYASIAGPSLVKTTGPCTWFASPSDIAYTYQWFVNGVPAGNATDTFVRSNNATGFTLKVTIKDLAGGSASGSLAVKASSTAKTCPI